MSECSDYQDEYKDWLKTYVPVDFVDYSPEAFQKLKSETDMHYVWTNHGTCESEKYSNGIHEFNSGCGCWSNLGWAICQNPWEGDEDTYISVDTEWSGPCETCNADGEEKSIDPECPECDGDGYTQVYFN